MVTGRIKGNLLKLKIVHIKKNLDKLCYQEFFKSSLFKTTSLKLHNLVKQIPIKDKR